MVYGLCSYVLFAVLAVLHHVCDVHEWYQGQCEHDALM